MNLDQILSFAEHIIEAEPSIINKLKVCHSDAYGSAILLDTISSIPHEQIWASLKEAEAKTSENKAAFHEGSISTRDSRQVSLAKRLRSKTDDDSEAPNKVMMVGTSTAQVIGPDFGSPSSTEEYETGCTVSKVLFPVEPGDTEDADCDALSDTRAVSLQQGLSKRSPAVALSNNDLSTVANSSNDGFTDPDDAGVFPFTYSSFPPSCSPPELSQTALTMPRSAAVSTEVSFVVLSQGGAASDPLGLTSWPGLLWSRTHLFNLPCPLTVRQTVGRPDSFVLYLVQTAFRATDNLALAAAASLANHLGKPLIAMALLDADCCKDIVVDRLSARTTLQSSSEPPRAGLNTVTPLRPAAARQLSSSTPSLSAAEAAFRRKSDCRFRRTLSMERELAATGIAFVCEVFADVLDRQSIIDIAVSSAAVVCTDTYLHPSIVNECNRLRVSHPEVPLFAVDSNSLLLNRKPTTGSAGVSAEASAPDWLSLDIFEALLDEAVSVAFSRGEALDRSHTEWRECHRAVVRVGMHSNEVSTSTAASAFRRRIADSRCSASERTTWSELVAQCSSGCVGDEWSDPSEYVVGVLQRIDREDRVSAVPVRLSAEVRDRYLSGLLSPLQLADLLDTVQQCTESDTAGESGIEAQKRGASRVLLRLLRQDLLSAEYARYICSSSCGFVSSGASESVRCDSPSVNWLDFLPTSIVERIQDWYVDAKCRASGHLLYPDALRRGSTGHDLFDTIQRRLVLSGEVPSGDSMRLWILYLVRHLPSLETAVRVALTEIATYCDYDLSTADSDGSYIIPLSLMQGIVDCMEHLGTSRDGLDGDGKEKAVDPTEHIRLMETVIKSKNVVLN